jgi:hypothetical protein
MGFIMKKQKYITLGGTRYSQELRIRYGTSASFGKTKEKTLSVLLSSYYMIKEA